MIRTFEGLPANVVGFEAIGHVDAGDYKSVLDPAIDSALADNDTIRLLYVLGSEFEGFTGGAMWEDTKAGISHWSMWERIAVVTDHVAVTEGVRFLGWMVPGEVRVFALDALEEAKAWLAG